MIIVEPNTVKARRKELLATKLRTLHRGFLLSSRNPLFAWEAMQYCLSYQQLFIDAEIPEECPPNWVRDYFLVSIDNLLNIRSPNKDAPEEIPRALSLSSDIGKSLFNDYIKTRRNLDIYDEFQRLTRKLPQQKLKRQEELMASESFSKFPYEYRQELLKRIRPQYQPMKKKDAREKLARTYLLSVSRIRAIIRQINQSLDVLVQEDKNSA